jgi:hypothetical protein
VTGTKFSRKKPNSPYSINQPHTYFKIQLIIKSTYPLRICLVYFSGRRTMPRDTTHRCNSKQNVPSPWPVAAQKGQISTRERESTKRNGIRRARTNEAAARWGPPSFLPAGARTGTAPRTVAGRCHPRGPHVDAAPRASTCGRARHARLLDGFWFSGRNAGVTQGLSHAHASRGASCGRSATVTHHRCVHLILVVVLVRQEDGNTGTFNATSIARASCKSGSLLAPNAADF